MSVQKISALTTLAETPADGDWVPVVDVSAGETKKVAFSDMGGGGMDPDYIAALGLVDLTGFGGLPTLFDPTADSWDEYGWWQMEFLQDVTDTEIKLTLGVGDGTGTNAWIYSEITDVDYRTANTRMRVQNADASEGLQAASVAEISSDGTVRTGFMEVAANGTLGGYIGMYVDQSHVQYLAAAHAAQTDPLLDLQDSDGNSTARIFPDTNGAELLKISTTDSSITGMESLVLGADLMGTDATITVQGGGQLSLTVNDTIYNSSINIGGGVGIIIGHIDDAVGFYGATPQAQGAAIADSSAVTVSDRFNDLLAYLRLRGDIAT